MSQALLDEQIDKNIQAIRNANSELDARRKQAEQISKQILEAEKGSTTSTGPLPVSVKHAKDGTVVIEAAPVAIPLEGHNNLTHREYPGSIASSREELLAIKQQIAAQAQPARPAQTNAEEHNS